MVAKCANPACNRLFRELSKGRLFLLPPTSAASYWTWSAGKLSDHCYWLCPECDATYTITRLGPEVIISVREPGSAYPSDAASSSSNKDSGNRPRQVSPRRHTERGELSN